MSRNETVEEYLKRGGKITKLKTVDSPTGSLLSAPCSVGWSRTPKPQKVSTVMWSDLYAEEEPGKKDTQYWKKLNKAMDRVLKQKKT